MNTLGDRIRQARKSRDLTQLELATKLGIDQSTVSGWESDDKRRPSRDLMPSVAKVLGRTVDWLEGRDGGMTDRGRDYDSPDDAVADEPATPDPIDESLLTEVIRMAMRNMIASYGVDIPSARFEAAAEAAASAYRNYVRLRRVA